MLKYSSYRTKHIHLLFTVFFFLAVIRCVSYFTFETHTHTAHLHTHTAHLPVLMFVYALSGHFWFNSTILLLFDMTCTHTVVMRSVWPLPGLTNSDTDNNIEVGG